MMRDSSYRTEVLWHSYVTNRIRKILAAPGSSEDLLTPEVFVSPSQSGVQSSFRPGVQDEYSRLERKFAKEVQTIWEKNKTFEPYVTLGPYVNAEVGEHPLPISDLNLPENSLDLSRTMTLLRSMSQMRPRRKTLMLSEPRRTSVTDFNSGDVLPPGSVVTLSYKTLKTVVTDGRMKLIG